jgi:transposase
MEWLRIQLTEDEQRIVIEGRQSHPDACVRRRLWALWLLHCGTTREQAARIVGMARSSVERFVAEYRRGGLAGLMERPAHWVPTSDLAVHRETIRAAFEQQPVRTTAEACQRIFELTGIRRQPTQVRKFLKDMGMRWQRVRAIPVPPKKTWGSTLPIKPRSMMAS